MVKYKHWYLFEPPCYFKCNYIGGKKGATLFPP